MNKTFVFAFILSFCFLLISQAAFADKTKAKTLDDVLIQGLAEARHGLVSQALKYYISAAQMPPSATFDVNSCLVRELVQRDEFVVAKKFVERVRSIKPNTPDADVLTGLIEVEDEHPDRGKEFYLKAITAKKLDDPAPLAFAARGLAQLGDNDKALAVLAILEKHWQNYPPASFCRGLCLLSQKKDKEAQPLLRKGYLFQPTGNNLALLTSVDCRLHDWKACVEDSKNTSNIPGSILVRILIDRADALRELKRYEEAAQTYSAALRVRESNKAYSMRALCYEKIGKKREAAEDRARAIEVFEDFSPAAPVKRI